MATDRWNGSMLLWQRIESFTRGSHILNHARFPYTDTCNVVEYSTFESSLKIHATLFINFMSPFLFKKPCDALPHVSFIMMKIFTVIGLVLAMATRDTVGHCWPCNGMGEFTIDNDLEDGVAGGPNFGNSDILITDLKKCLKCCNYIIKNGYQQDEPFSEAVFSHRKHCRTIHCKDWAKATNGSIDGSDDSDESSQSDSGDSGDGASCDRVIVAAVKDGTDIMRPFCPTEHRCNCNPKSPGGPGCVGGPAGWDYLTEGDYTYGCARAACANPAVNQAITW